LLASPFLLDVRIQRKPVMVVAAKKDAASQEVVLTKAALARVVKLCPYHHRKENRTSKALFLAA